MVLWLLKLPSNIKGVGSCYKMLLSSFSCIASCGAFMAPFIASCGTFIAACGAFIVSYNEQIF